VVLYGHKFKKQQKMNYPNDRKYTENHLWIKVVNNNIVEMGVTHYIVEELGNLIYLDVDSLGETFSARYEFGTLGGFKGALENTILELVMPIDGKILKINSRVDPDKDDDTELINDDPYGTWIVKVEVSDPSQLEVGYSNILDAETYEAWSQNLD